MNNIYGVLDSNGCHVDVSNSERGAKNYATRHGYDVVTVRYNSGYNADSIATKINGKWLQGYITPANRKPVIIDSIGLYKMRNGIKARIDTIKPNDNKSVTAFTCKGAIERLFRGKKAFKGFSIWHESGQSTGVESEYDIIEKL